MNVTRLPVTTFCSTTDVNYISLSFSCSSSTHQNVQQGMQEQNYSTWMFRLFIMSDLTYSRQHILFQSVVWRRRRYVPITCWYPPPRLHDVTVQITLWTLIALKTLELTIHIWLTRHYSLSRLLTCWELNSISAKLSSLFPPRSRHKNRNHILPAHVRVN